MAADLTNPGHKPMTENDLLDPDVPLTAIRLDGGTQSRAAMDEAAIAEYAEALKQGATLPPLVVFFDGATFWLADGFHRYHAYRAAGVDFVAAEVRTGTLRDAVLFSVGANAAHGLRRTNADKRRAVETLLADAEWSAWSDREIARRCCVHHDMVAVARKSLADSASEKPAERTYTTKHGTPATMNTANIGKVQEPVEYPAPYAAAIAPAMAAVDQALALAKDRPVETTGRPAANELAELREELASLKASFAETLADNEAMGRVFDADDRLQEAVNEVKRQTAIAASAESRMHAKMGECAEAIKSLKYWKNRAERAEKLNQAAA